MDRIFVKSYMTKKSTPDFDFMAKWNNDNPMPLREMVVDEYVKETRGMIYIKCHADILRKVTHRCMCCGRPLTNKVSQFFGIGGECGKHNYVNPFESEEELNRAIDKYRHYLSNITWEGWIVKSAILECDKNISINGKPSDETIETIECKKRLTIDVEDNMMYLTFDYDTDVIESIRNLPVRRWVKETKQWEIPVKSINKIKSIFNSYDITINGEIKEEKHITIDDIKGFEYKTKPYEHQVDGVNYGLNNDKWLLGDEQGLGKALALDTKVYTPTGYKLMKDIQVGDYVFGKDGKPTKVTAIYNHSNVEMYRITFSDGVSIDCCKDHLWQIHDQHGTKIVDTKWFTEKDQFNRVRKDNLFSSGSRSYKYWIDRCEPVQFEYQNIPVDPYVLGALLGDGGLTSNSVFFTTADDEMVDNINSRLPKGYELCSAPSMSDIDFYIKGIKGNVNVIKNGFIELGLWKTNSHTKFIPDVYKYNSIAVRTEVLQGLIDTDGYATKDNLLQFATVSKQLCEDVKFLVESLGGIVSYSEKDCGYDGKITGRCYILTIKFDRPQLYCTLTRKKSLLKDRHFKTRRNIVAIERIKNADAKCITVDNDEHLYLIDHFVVTHNTKQIIDLAVAKKLQKGYKHCLIICGVNGLKWNWANEVKTHSNENALILGQKVNKKGRIVIGATSDKIADLRRLNEIDEYFIITNIESLRNDEIIACIKSLVKDGQINMIAFDECHKAKNPTSQQGKALLKINAETMVAMSGTPLMNNPLDLYVPLKWLGYEGHSFYNFKNHYCEMGGYGGYEILGYKNLEQLENQLDEIMLRRLKEDVLDLPEKTFIDEFVDMTPKQAIIYKEVSMDIQSNIDKIKSSPNPLAEMIRLRQATGYTGILSSKIQESAKLDRVAELVEEVLENGKKVVIFSNWSQMTDAIDSRLARIKMPNTYASIGSYTALITGETKDELRQDIVDAFQNTDELRVLIGTIGAMGTGLTLTAGTVVIFVDHPWNMALYQQAVDRCHRIGQKNNITIYNLICKNTIDERIWELVKYKGELSDKIIDGVDISDKSSVVDYLLS